MPNNTHAKQYNSNITWKANATKIVGAIFVAAILFALNFWSARQYSFNADTAHILLHGMDIFQTGEVFSHTWINAQINYIFTANIINGLAGTIFGPVELAVKMAGAFNYTILMLACIALGMGARYKNVSLDTQSINSKKKSQTNNSKTIDNFWISSAIIFVLMIFPPQGGTFLDSVMHVEAYSTAVISLILIEMYHEANKKRWLVFYTILLTIVTFSDTILLIAFSLPASVILLCNVIWKQENRKSLEVLIATSISILASLLIDRIAVSLLGVVYSPHYSAKASIDIQNIGQKLLTSYQVFLEYFGGDIWSTHITFSIDMVKLAMGFGIFTAVAIYTLYLFRHFFILDETDQIMLACIVGQTAAFTFSTEGGLPSRRYLMLPVVFLIILVGKSDLVGGLKIAFQNRPKALKYMIPIVFIVCFLIFALKLPKFSLTPPVQRMHHITEYLLENGYTNGYAPYWYAGEITLDSGRQIRVASIGTYNNKTLAPYRILMDYKWFTKDKNFVVSNPNAFSEEMLAEIFGPPATKHEFWNGDVVYTWDYDISMHVYQYQR